MNNNYNHKHEINIIFNFRYTIKLFINYTKNLYNNYSIDRIKFRNYSSFIIGYIITSYYIEKIYQLNLFVIYSLYWIIIGILSTIGFGFGLQTGLLFLSPYLINNFNQLNSTSDSVSDGVTNNLLICYIQCLDTVVLWGIGTALGELPPFLLAKHYNENNENNGNNENNETTKLINKYKNNIIFKNLTNYLKKYRFLSIVLFSSWPNITFDMCGLMCGYYNFKLHQFLIPTLIGKSLIKAPIQAFMMLYIYSNNKKFNSDPSTQYTIIYLWYCIQYSLILYFIKSSIEVIAKLQYKMELKDLKDLKDL